MLTPVNVEQFGGLNMAADPEEVGLGGAIDLLNIDFDRSGRIRQRDGYAKFTTSAASAAYGPIAFYQGNFTQIVCSRGDADIQVIDLNGNNVRLLSNDFASHGNASYRTFAAYGTPSSTRLYTAGVGNGVETLFYWDGSNFVSSGLRAARAFSPALVAVTPWDNRLAAGKGPLLATANRVHFSNPGDPATWAANSYVDIRPGDGEPVTALVTWRDYLFAFKKTVAYVFYGTNTDSSGSPIFNYRQITLEDGPTGPWAVAAGDDGLYWSGLRGIYRSTGGKPELISQPIAAWFARTTTSFWQGATNNPQNDGTNVLMWQAGRLYASLAVPTVPGYVLFVWDRATGLWSYWDIGAAGLAWNVNYPTTGSSTNEFLFAYGTGLTNNLGKFSASYTSDAGTAITSRYRSGFSDLGLPGREKTVRQTELVGQGTVSLGWSRDMGAITTSSTGSVTLGAGAFTARGLHRLAQNGELLGWQASSVNGGAWQLNRATAFVRRPRVPGEKSA